MSFAIMVMKRNDFSNNEQVFVCLRYVEDDMAVSEEVFGLYSSELICGNIQHVLFTHESNYYYKCWGQCYDLASNTSGSKSGVTIKIACLEPRKLYTHYYDHAF